MGDVTFVNVDLIINVARSAFTFYVRNDGVSTCSQERADEIKRSEEFLESLPGEMI